MGSWDSGHLGLAGLSRQVKEDWLVHHRDWSAPGFRALVMYRFGVWQRHMRATTLPTKALRRLTKYLYLAMHRYIRNHYGIELHNTAVIGRRLYIPHPGTIVIHRFAEIGDDCLISHGVTLGSAGEPVVRKFAPRLGNHVKVGAGAKILGKVTVGDGAKIGANAVVLTDVGPNITMVVGAPRLIHRSTGDQKSAGANLNPSRRRSGEPY